RGRPAPRGRPRGPGARNRVRGRQGPRSRGAARRPRRGRVDEPAGAPILARAEDRMPLEPAIYADRRRRLMQRMGDRASAVFFAAPEAVRSNDTHFDYRQSSDLLYLTGFEEPEAALVLLPGHEKHPIVFFVRKRDKEREVWDGPRAGPEGAKER